MRGWCRYPRSNSTHEGQISEIDILVRLNLNDFWIGYENRNGAKSLSANEKQSQARPASPRG